MTLVRHLRGTVAEDSLFIMHNELETVTEKKGAIKRGKKQPQQQDSQIATMLPRLSRIPMALHINTGRRPTLSA